MTQLSLQSKPKLTGDVYIRVRPEARVVLDIEEDELLYLNKPDYRFYDARASSALTMSRHLLCLLGMQPTIEDLAVSIKTLNEIVTGVSALYVDDLLHARNSDFEKRTELMLKMLDSNSKIYNSFKFFGAHFKTKMIRSFGIL